MSDTPGGGLMILFPTLLLCAQVLAAQPLSPPERHQALALPLRHLTKHGTGEGTWHTAQTDAVPIRRSVPSDLGTWGMGMSAALVMASAATAMRLCIARCLVGSAVPSAVTCTWHGRPAVVGAKSLACPGAAAGAIRRCGRAGWPAGAAQAHVDRGQPRHGLGQGGFVHVALHPVGLLVGLAEAVPHASSASSRQQGAPRTVSTPQTL